MKHYERRTNDAFPYYKLATFDERSFTYRDGKVAYASEDDAKNAAKGSGKFRVSIVTEKGRKDCEPFIR